MIHTRVLYYCCTATTPLFWQGCAGRSCWAILSGQRSLGRKSELKKGKKVQKKKTGRKGKLVKEFARWVWGALVCTCMRACPSSPATLVHCERLKGLKKSISASQKTGNINIVFSQILHMLRFLSLTPFCLTLQAHNDSWLFGPGGRKWPPWKLHHPWSSPWGRPAWIWRTGSTWCLQERGERSAAAGWSWRWPPAKWKPAAPQPAAK